MSKDNHNFFMTFSIAQTTPPISFIPDFPLPRHSSRRRWLHKYFAWRENVKVVMKPNSNKQS